MIDPRLSPEPTAARGTMTVSVSTLVLLVLAGVALGAAVTWAVTGNRGVPQEVRGTITAVDWDVSAIGFRADGDEYGADGGEGLALVGNVPWTDTSGVVHAGNVPPSCLPPGSHGQRVELGILELHDSGSHVAPTNVVVWVRCL